MSPKSRRRKTVQYELMLGREATDAIRAFPVGYLPIGCLERHGDHLPMGLDVIKASREIGEQQLQAIIAHLRERIRQAPGYPFGG